MSPASAKEFFEAIATKANRSCEGTKIMREWVGHYYGKIIQFDLDAEKFHLVVSNGGMTVVDGEYPAPDLTLRGSSKLILDVFTGRKRFGVAVKNWELVLIGAGHDGFVLGGLIATITLEV